MYQFQHMWEDIYRSNSASVLEKLIQHFRAFCRADIQYSVKEIRYCQKLQLKEFKMLHFDFALI